MPKVKRGGACHGVDAHHGDQQAQRAGNHGLDQGFSGQGHQQRDPDDHEREELGRADQESHFTERLGRRHQAYGGDGAADEGPDRGQRQRGPCPADLGHGVAVDGSNRGRRFTGGVQQDAGDGAAVLGAVEDGAEHDDRPRRVQIQRDGDQQGHACHWSYPGQDPDDGAQQAAEEGKNQVLPGHGGGKAAKEFIEGFHA